MKINCENCIYSKGFGKDKETVFCGHEKAKILVIKTNCAAQDYTDSSKFTSKILNESEIKNINYENRTY
jgi:hypothetical protein